MPNTHCDHIKWRLLQAEQNLKALRIDIGVMEDYLKRHPGHQECIMPLAVYRGDEQRYEARLRAIQADLDDCYAKNP